MKLALCLVGSLALFAPRGEDPKGALVVLNKSDANITLHDPTSGDVLATLDVGAGPHEAATSPDGSRVVVCNYGERTPGTTLTVIDASERKVLRTIDLLEYQRPHGIVFLPDGKRVLVTAEVEKKLLVVNISLGKVESAIDTDQELSHMVAVAPDGKHAYVSNIGSGSISVLDLVAHETIDVVETGAGAEGIAVQPKTGAIWVTNRSANTVSVIDPVTHLIRKQIETGTFPIRVGFTPDGTRALVSCAKDDAVQIYDSASFELVATVSMTAPSVEDAERAGRLFGTESEAQAMPIGILVEPSGKLAFIANTMADIVTVIDIPSARVLRRISTGRQPDGMTWVPLP